MLSSQRSSRLLGERSPAFSDSLDMLNAAPSFNVNQDNIEAGNQSMGLPGYVRNTQGESSADPIAALKANVTVRSALKAGDSNRNNGSLSKRVFGYHPYWTGTKWTAYRWDLLSDLCYFSYEVDPLTGNAL
jgi:hypothetical protein